MHQKVPCCFFLLHLKGTQHPVSSAVSSDFRKPGVKRYQAFASSLNVLEARTR